MNTPRYLAAGSPAATDVVIAHGIDGRGWRRLRSIGEVVGLVATVPAAIASIGLAVFLLKWALGAATR